MKQKYVGLTIGSFNRVVLFVFMYCVKAAFVQSTTKDDGASWQGMTYSDLGKCPENQVVVGMCSSTHEKPCKLNDAFQVHKLKCRKLDPDIYSTTDKNIKTEMLEEKGATRLQQGGYSYKYLVQTCTSSNMFIGGFCVSVDGPQCGPSRGFVQAFYNQVECRTGYEIIDGNNIQTRDVCGNIFGTDVECPKDEADGPWVAIGMCRGSLAAPCSDLKCSEDAKLYGLRCAKLKKQQVNLLSSSNPTATNSSETKSAVEVLNGNPEDLGNNGEETTQQETTQQETTQQETTQQETTQQETTQQETEEHKQTAFDSIFAPSKSNLEPYATRPDEEIDKLVEQLMKKTESKGVILETWCDTVFVVLTVLYLLAFNG